VHDAAGVLELFREQMKAGFALVPWENFRPDAEICERVWLGLRRIRAGAGGGVGLSAKRKGNKGGYKCKGNAAREQSASQLMEDKQALDAG
jgi:hypothetical protein